MAGPAAPELQASWDDDEPFSLADLPTAPYTPESMLPQAPAPALGRDTRLSLLDDVDLSLDEPTASPAEIAPIGAVDAEAVPEDVDLPLDMRAIGDAPSAVATPPAEPPHERTEPLSTRTSPLLPPPRPDPAEGFRQIGPLRVGVQLFNIFVGEADELLADLTEQLQAWRAAPDRAPGERAVARAHSLAGNASTVGYGGLAHLARLLEHALERAQARGHGLGDEPELFCQAADEVRRLLHLFAAGFLNPPNAQMVQRLEALAQAEADLADQAPSRPMPLDDLRPAQASPHQELSELAGAGLHPLAERAAVALPEQRSALGAHGLAFDDEIDQQDAVDADLFPVFEDEASELLPRLHASLRAWSHRPADASLASACMRSLHTFKGGARLAGAMRLGELAHRLETAVERLVAHSALPSATDIEALVAHADTLDNQFERLRKAAGPTVMDSLHAPLTSVPGALLPLPPTPVPVPVPVTESAPSEAVPVPVPALEAEAAAPLVTTAATHLATETVANPAPAEPAAPQAGATTAEGLADLSDAGEGPDRAPVGAFAEAAVEATPPEAQAAGPLAASGALATGALAVTALLATPESDPASRAVVPVDRTSRRRWPGPGFEPGRGTRFGLGVARAGAGCGGLGAGPGVAGRRPDGGVDPRSVFALARPGATCRGCAA